MKTLLLILFTTIATAQFRLNETENCNLSVITSPYNNFNIGVEFEFDSCIYVRPTIFYSDQENKYIKAFAGVGLPFTIGWEEKITVYSGLRLGVIHRERLNGFAGFETGINFKISDGIIIGIRETLDFNSDYKFFDNEQEKELKTVIKIGINL